MALNAQAPGTPRAGAERRRTAMKFRLDSADAGLLLTVPFTGIPSSFGSWNVHGGVNVLGFGDTTKSFNNGDAAQVVVSGGIAMSY